jgi:hypothetical protein
MISGTLKRGVPLKRFALFTLLLLLVASPLMAQKKLTLKVYPSKLKMVAGTSVRFTAVAKDYAGMAQTPSGLIWMAGSGTINRNGKYTAPKRAGVYKVKVAVGKLVAQAKVTVLPLKKATPKERKHKR